MLSRASHQRLALWAAACAMRLLPLFEGVRPRDPRPRRAIEAARDWARRGLSFPQIRKASLAAHAAARAVKDPAAKAAARAAGHAVAVGHVPTHARGLPYYGRQACLAAGGEARWKRELAWQKRHLPRGLKALIFPPKSRG